MKQQIFQDICLKLDELRIPYMQDEQYIRVNTAFYDVGVGVEPKKVTYELSVCIDENNRSVSMVVRTADEYLLAAGDGVSPTPSSSIFRKVRHISYDSDGEGTITVIDLGEVPNTVKNTAVKYGWKFRTALNLNRPPQKVRREPATPVATEAAAESEPATPTAPVTQQPATATPKAGLWKRLFGRAKYKPKH